MDKDEKRNTTNDDKIMDVSYEQFKSSWFTRRQFNTTMETAGFKFDDFTSAFTRLFEKGVIIKAGEIGLAWVYRLKRRRKNVGK